MSGFRFQSSWISNRGPVLAMAATLAMFAGGISLLTVPMIRSAEASQGGSSHERCEDPTLISRVEHEKQLHLDSARVAFLLPTLQSLGHAQRPVLDPLPGHRIANGLLAPMTC